MKKSILFVGIAVLLGIASACQDNQENKAATPKTAPVQKPVAPPPVPAPAPPPVQAPVPEPVQVPAPPPVPGQALTPVQVVMMTSLGEVKMELYPDKAPITVENFLKYVDAKFYEGTIFHRVIGTFMIQGGGFTPDFKEKPTNPPIKNEAANGLANEIGTIAMARTGVVDSATSQFYINVTNNAMLNHRDTSMQGFGYCVFGKVTSGMDVVDKIKAVKTGAKGPFRTDAPQEDVIILSIQRAP